MENLKRRTKYDPRKAALEGKNALKGKTTLELKSGPEETLEVDTYQEPIDAEEVKFDGDQKKKNITYLKRKSKKLPVNPGKVPTPVAENKNSTWTKG